MDDRTKQFTDRIFQKMNQIEEKISEKSTMLYQIREEMMHLAENARKLQSELNQISIDQCENMKDFQLLCEHLATKTNRKTQFLNKVAGDVPLAHSAQNISQVCIDMPKAESSAKSYASKVAGNVPLAHSAKNISKVSMEMPIAELSAKSRANKVIRDESLAPSAKNISTVGSDMPDLVKGRTLSVKADKTSEKSEFKTNSSFEKKFVNIAGTSSSSNNQFSNFMVGKIHPKEEEYLAFTRQIYALPKTCGETYGALSAKSIYPRIAIFPGASPGFTAKLFEFGYLDRVYSSPDFSELSQLPSELVSSIQTITPNSGAYCRFFSISMEFPSDQVYIPTITYIVVEPLKTFSINATGVTQNLPYLNTKWIRTRRALGMKALYGIISKYYKDDYKVLHQNSSWVLLSKGKSKSKLLFEKLTSFETHQFTATEETWKLACKFMNHKHQQPSSGEDNASTDLSEDMEEI